MSVKRGFVCTLLSVAIGALLLPRAAFAFPGLDGAVVDMYPSAIELENCGTCHSNFTAYGPLNEYGRDFNDNLVGFDVAGAFLAIENLDSDGDGAINIEEILAGDGFHPGWTCEDYTQAINPPTNLVDIVDPNDVGCTGGGTTTTTNGTSTTTSTSSTSSTSTSSTSSTSTSSTTTLPGGAQCGQPVSSGASPVATDCLYILQAAVTLVTCSPECICAPTGSLPVKATDALLCLNVSVGIPLELNCPCAVAVTAGAGLTDGDGF